ncbi:MAG: hypothetical protein IT177_10265 [Acidobacteria bacterium]|nr:hypothetical protein [Acidobacteriota bacterium]
MDRPGAPLVRAHVWLSVFYALSRAALWLAGLPFRFDLDWMWLADPGDLRDRLLETLYYFHAFPPGMDFLTGILLKLGGARPESMALGLFWAMGLVLVNALFVLGRATGLSTRAAFGLALAFALTPPAIYFEHLYLYEWPVTTMLCVAAACFHRGVRTGSTGAWAAFFGLCAAIGLTRSTFHLVWFALMMGAALWAAGRQCRHRVLGAAAIPAALLVALYLKNLIVFGAFAASTFGPASFHLVTVDRLPRDVRDQWIRDGLLSPFAAISAYAPPREYARFFATPDLPGWPPQVTRLEHVAVRAPNFNHWWLIEVHRARSADVRRYLRERWFEYPATVLTGLGDYFGPSTSWHPRAGLPGAPHAGHRALLGVYESAYNRTLHTFPFAPVGVYVLLPVILVWAARIAWSLLRQGDRGARARGAVLAFLVLQVLYVTAASTMLTFLESSRYRFQVEPLIWVLTAACVADAWTRYRGSLVRPGSD